MLTLKVHHIGYLVKKKDAACAAFLALGYEPETDWVRDELRGIDIRFLTKDGMRIELVSPYTKEASVYDLMKRLKNSPYHICYQSEHYEEDLTALRDMGYLPITENAPAPALGDRNVTFLLHPSLGMIEVLGDSEPVHN